MNPQDQALVDSGQQQAEQNFSNDFNPSNISSLASLGSTTQQAQDALNTANNGPVAGAAPGAVTSGPHPGILERLLPTIGGVVGGIAGAPLDPFTGGLASVGLAGLLGGAGKAAENGLTGQKILQGDDLTSAAENAVSQGIGKGASLVLGKGGQALDNLGANMAENATAKSAAQAADQAAANKALLYGDAVKAAKDPSISANFQSTLDNAEKNYGIDTSQSNAPQLMSEVGDAQTGGNIENGQGALNQKVDEIIDKNGGNVNLGNIGDELNQSVSNLNSTAGNSGALDEMVPKGKTMVSANNPTQKAVQEISNLSPKLSTSGGTGLTASQMTSQEANALAKSLQKIAFSKVPVSSTGFQDPVGLAKQKISSDLYNYVRGEVDNQPGLSGAVKGLRSDPDLENFVDSKVANISDPNVAAATKDKLMGAFHNANSIQDLRAAQADAVQLSKLGDQVDNFNSERTYLPGAVKRAGAETNSVKGNVLSADNAVNVGSVLEGTLGHHPAALALPMLLKAAENPAVVQGVGKGISAIGNSVAPGIVGSIIGNSPNDVAGPAGASTDVTQGPITSPQNNILDQALYEAMQNPLNGGLSQMGALLPLVQKANAAQAAEQNLASNYNQAGGAQGPLGGILSRLGATFTGGEAGQYGGQAQADAQAIANATGVPLQQVESSLPSLGENQSAAQASLGNIQSLIQALTQGNMPGGVVAGAQQ